MTSMVCKRVITYDASHLRCLKRIIVTFLHDLRDGHNSSLIEIWYNFENELTRDIIFKAFSNKRTNKSPIYECSFS